MSFVTSFERAGEERGLQKGRQEGRAAERSELLLLQLEAKFGSGPSEGYRARIEQASEAVIRAWLIRLLTADTIDAVFADG